MLLVRVAHIRAAGFAAFVLSSTAAFAQQPVIPQPGQSRPLPEIAPPSPNLDFTIQAPRRSPVPRAVEELTFDVKDVRIEGATLYSAESLHAMAAPVIGKTVHLSDLIAVAEAIEGRYHAEGYILTRAFVPTQNVNDGVFQVSVVEGYVAAVAVQGGEQDSRERIEALLSPVTQSRPLQLAKLESALLTANLVPGLNVSGMLRPSPTEPAASELVLNVGEAPVGASLTADNYGNQATGRWTVAASGSAHSPFGDGGQITLDASANPHIPHMRHSFHTAYVAPVPFAPDFTYTLSVLSSHGAPAGTSDGGVQLITNSLTVGARVSTPLLETRLQKLTIDAGLTVQSSDVNNLGTLPLQTHDEWRVADVALAYQNNDWLDGSTNISLDVSQGIPALGATPDGWIHLARQGGSTQFTKITGMLHHTNAIAGPLSISLTINGQYAFDTLLTGEETSYGGNFIGRGYDPGSITGDMGIGSALELRYDFNADALSLEQLQLYGFYDNARVRNRSGSSHDDDIASAGAGLRIGALKHVSLGVEFGKVLIGVPGYAGGRHDQRVMTNIAVRY